MDHREGQEDDKHRKKIAVFLAKWVVMAVPRRTGTILFQEGS